MLYQRQKFLLTFLQAFGGELSETDCQNLVFLYCQSNQRDFYDFFPGKLGPFSFVLSEDKGALTRKEMLKASENYLLSESAISIVEEYDAKEKALLFQFRDQLNGVRGQALIQKTLDEYPFSEYSKASQVVTENGSMLYSIGYEGMTIDRFLNILISNHIEVLFDVRGNPLSRKFGFSKTKLKECTQAVGINYIHLPGLGIPSANRKNLTTNEDLFKLFDRYYDETLATATDTLNIIIDMVRDNHPSVLLCFEADYRLCHRSSICKKIYELSGITATHL
ncbi:MAG: DUF488 domain-containing protein [Anaerolineaceae bacterium]|nr:DUF488 domain-containing protein [Anaerolineaceae bacterium]